MSDALKISLRKQVLPNLTANDLKTKGIAAIEAALAERPGSNRLGTRQRAFRVMEIAQYQYLRECELEVALAEEKADIAAGRFNKGTPAAHVMRVKMNAA